MRCRLRIVRPKVDKELVETLTKLRDDAARGELIGIAYTALRAGQGFEGDVLGAVRRHRLYMQGLALELLKVAANIGDSRH